LGVSISLYCTRLCCTRHNLVETPKLGVSTTLYISLQGAGGDITVTIRGSVRLYTVIYFMTVKEYNRSVEEYSDSVYRFIRTNLKDEERANDIVQDSYEKLWRNVTDIEYPVVKSWLFTTAYRTMIDIIRKENRMTSIEDQDVYDLISESQYSDLNEILHLALERLPENQKSLVLLRDYEGYSYKEIGEITGLTEAQVKINIYRGRVALKNFIVRIETVI
jgi:RNA polymerase sigma factor (sigma-70 family)